MRKVLTFVILGYVMFLAIGLINRSVVGPALSPEQQAWLKKVEPYKAMYGEPPEYNTWDGTYWPVKRYLEKTANDPSSITFSGCSDVEVSRKGWLVGCNYRGANVFGGIVKKANWFTIRHGQVVQIHDLKPTTISLQ